MPPKQQDSRRCAFFLEKKNRFCTQLRASGAALCHLHRQISAPSSEWEERVVCPLGNGSHTVRRSQLERHLAHCSERDQDPRLLPCFTENVNASPDLLCQESPTRCADLETQTSTLNDGEAMPAMHFRNLTQTGFERFVSHLEMVWRRFSLSVLRIEHHDAFPGLEGYVTQFKMKHTKQHVSLLHQISACVKEGRNLSSTSFLELGAGKGGLALAVKYAAPTAKVVVADQSKFRDMLDRLTHSRKRSADEAEGDSGMTQRLVVPVFDPPLERVLINVKDFDFAKYVASDRPLHVDATAKRSHPREEGEAENNRWMVIGKHLCGACTDFALNCLAGNAPHFCGCVVATCCHQLCSWEAFAGRHASPSGCTSLPVIFPSVHHFECSRTIASWGVGGDTVDPGKRRIGRLAKFAIDACRVLALRESTPFTDAFLVDYIGEAVTGENHVIVARLPRSVQLQKL